MKKTYICIGIVALTLLTACSRGRITVEYSEPTDAPVLEAGHNNDNQGNNESDGISSNLEFRKNPLCEYAEDGTIYKVWFPNTCLADEREKIWNEISSLPEVERVHRSTEEGGNLIINLDKLNPQYYRMLVDYIGADENLMKERGWEAFQVNVYTSPDIEKNTLSMCHSAKELNDWWDKEEWPFYIEENDEVRLDYSYDETTNKSATVKIESITDKLPWYLNFAWTSNEAILLLKEDEYRRLFAEDDTGRNISKLSVFEWYFVESKEGCQKELEKKLLELGAKEIGREGYLRED